MSTNPMHQFEVYRIGPEINLGTVNLSFTNASLFMMISATIILFLLFLGTKKNFNEMSNKHVQSNHFFKIKRQKISGTKKLPWLL